MPRKSKYEKLEFYVDKLGYGDKEEYISNYYGLGGISQSGFEVQKVRTPLKESSKHETVGFGNYILDLTKGVRGWEIKTK